MSGIHWVHLRADRENREDTYRLWFNSAEEDEAPFLAWTSMTFLRAHKDFERGEAVGIDITHIGAGSTNRHVWGGLHLGDEGADENLRYGAVWGTSRNVRARLRVFGDLSAVGYCCTMPMNQVRSDVQSITNTNLTVMPPPFNQVDEMPILISPSPTPFVAWVGISYIDPVEEFHGNAGVAVDIIEVDNAALNPIYTDNDLLGPDGSEDNLFPGVVAGTAGSLRVRLRTFSDDFKAAAYVCVLHL